MILNQNRVTFDSAQTSSYPRFYFKIDLPYILHKYLVIQVLFKNQVIHDFF